MGDVTIDPPEKVLDVKAIESPCGQVIITQGGGVDHRAPVVTPSALKTRHTGSAESALSVIEQRRLGIRHAPTIRVSAADQVVVAMT